MNCLIVLSMKTFSCLEKTPATRRRSSECHPKRNTLMMNSSFKDSNLRERSWWITLTALSFHRLDRTARPAPMNCLRMAPWLLNQLTCASKVPVKRARNRKRWRILPSTITKNTWTTLSRIWWLSLKFPVRMRNTSWLPEIYGELTLPGTSGPRRSSISSSMKETNI